MQRAQHAAKDGFAKKADLRLIPHVVHAAKDGFKRIIVLSTDTDVFVLLLYYWHVLQQHGLKELWIRAGVDNTVRSEERRVGKECRSRWSPYH